MKIYNGLYILLLIFTFGCESSPRIIATSISVKSSPEDALVMVCNEREFNESKAVIIGKTPLMRYHGISEGGSSVCITKFGHHEWKGMITPEESEISASLKPFTKEENEHLELGTLSFNSIRIVPIRMGIREATVYSEELEDSNNSSEFAIHFMRAFQEKLMERFGEQIAVKEDIRLGKTKYWVELENVWKKINAEKVGYYSIPPRADLSPAFDSALSDIGGGILLVRAEAYYLSERSRSEVSWHLWFLHPLLLSLV